MAKVPINLTLDQEIKELLKSLAAAQHMNVSQYVTFLTLQNKSLLQEVEK